MLKSSETVNTLVRAKARIDHPNKWCKHKAIHLGRRCMMGANLNDRGEIVDSYQHVAFFNILQHVIMRMFPARTPDGNVPYFNDHPDTTHADVMRVFDEAIHTAE